MMLGLTMMIVASSSLGIILLLLRFDSSDALANAADASNHHHQQVVVQHSKLPSLKVGESIRIPIHDETNNKRRLSKICRLSMKPDIFVLRNILNKEECEAIMKEATSNSESMMVKAKTTSGANTRKYCKVFWKSRSDLAKRISPIVRSKTTTTITRSRDRPYYYTVEDLQVLRYEKKGEYTLHHDGQNRIGTVIYYLNGIAGTWFPFADYQVGNDFDENMMIPKLQEAVIASNSNIMNDSTDPKKNDVAAASNVQVSIPGKWTPGEDGLLIVGSSQQREIQALKDSGCNAASYTVVEPGDAVLFYNYCDNDDFEEEIMMKPDWRALHTGLEATDTKWIANHWFRLHLMQRK